jgi:hypothetical protein
MGIGIDDIPDFMAFLIHFLSLFLFSFFLLLLFWILLIFILALDGLPQIHI